MPSLQRADQNQLQKLLLGQLPSADVERLATEFADDSRLAELADSLAGSDDALLHLLHNHQTALVDPEGERLVERLVQRLKPSLPVKPQDDTAAMNRADATTEPSSPHMTATPQPIPERLEYYRPIKVLGQGGMGTVYLAEDTRLGREVAIKTLRPELAINPQAKERFLREARTAAKLEHDNVIPIYSVGEADGTPFLAMPLLKGEPLDALIRRTAGPLPVATVIRIAREAASGLGVAHARGLIHRDIKPANIWLEAPTGRVKILDFGLAKAAEAGGDADSETNLTASGAIVGTPAYMAPEQASGHTVDGRADLFSLGCVLYELLSGKRAFTGPNTMSILMSLANHTPPAPDKLSPQCPAALSQLVMQLLQKDPAKRPASAEAVIQALSELEVADTLARRASEGLEINAEINPSLARRASLEKAPGLPPNTAAVRGLTPPGSPTLLEIAQFNQDAPSGDTLVLSQVTPARKPSLPKRRIALALAGVLLTLLAAVVYRIQTDQGTLVVTIDDPAVQAILEQDGLVIRDKNSDRTWTIKVTEKPKLLPSGKYELDGKQNLQLLVTDDDGAEITSDEFTLKRKGERRVRVVMEQASNVAEKDSTKPIQSNPDRRAAEYVLSIGGYFRIKEAGQERAIEVVGDLPRGAFELTHVNLNNNQTSNLKVSDAGLVNFKDCKNLTTLNLTSVQVSDSGLAHFQDCKNLTDLRLHAIPATDAGLAYFRDCKNLTVFYLTVTQVSDAGLAHFKDCKNLTILNLDRNPQLSDVGLAVFKDCKNLMYLELGGTQVSDAGLAHFKDCKNLTLLDLNNTKVSDAGLVHFKDCKNLTVLGLGSTEVTDAGLIHFKDCKHLGGLGLSATQVSDAGLDDLAKLTMLTGLHITGCTKVTEAGVKKLSAALPGCKIEWDGGVIEPTVSPDRRAAEYVLSVGGGVVIDETQGYGDVRELPKTPFRLTAIEIHGSQQVTAAGLAACRGCEHLTRLQISQSAPVGDAGLEPFRECKKLKSLALAGTSVTDAGLAYFSGRDLTVLSLHEHVTDLGLAHFKDCHNLETLGLAHVQMTVQGLDYFQECRNLWLLDISNTPLGDEAFASLKNFPKLSQLSFVNAKMTNAGLVNLPILKELKYLSLAATQVDDAGIEQLKQGTKLTILYLVGTKLTAAGIDKLKQALPRCQITWDGGAIEPTESDQPK